MNFSRVTSIPGHIRLSLSQEGDAAAKLRRPATFVESVACGEFGVVPDVSWWR